MDVADLECRIDGLEGAHPSFKIASQPGVESPRIEPQRRVWSGIGAVGAGFDLRLGEGAPGVDDGDLTKGAWRLVTFWGGC